MLIILKYENSSDFRQLFTIKIIISNKIIQFVSRKKDEKEKKKIIIVIIIITFFCILIFLFPTILKSQKFPLHNIYLIYFSQFGKFSLYYSGNKNIIMNDNNNREFDFKNVVLPMKLCIFWKLLKLILIIQNHYTAEAFENGKRKTQNTKLTEFFGKN